MDPPLRNQITTPYPLVFHPVKHAPRHVCGARFSGRDNDMPPCLPATSIHQRINPFVSPTPPTSAFLQGPPCSLSLSLSSCNEPPSPSPSAAPPAPHKLAFHEQVVCFAVRAPFASLFVRRSKAGGLQPPVAMAAVRGKREGEGNRLFYPLFFYSPAPPRLSLNTRISTHREFNPRAFRERRRFLLGNSALFRSDCERPPPC